MSATIGTSPHRRDGAAKVTGAAQYVDDLKVEGCLYGATVRSPHAHAVIRKLALDPSYDWTDITVVTATDIPGKNTVLLMTEDQPVLAEQVVRHVAEAVALVAAPTRDRALEAARRVQVTYKPLPPLLNPRLSEDNELRIFGDSNVFKRITVAKGEVAGVQTGLLVTGAYSTGHQEQLYIEPQGMLAMPRPDGGITIIGSLQCPYYVHKAICAMLGHDRVNVVQAVTGGGFGGKEEYPSMIAAHATLLALKTGRPVKLIYRRDEDMLATTKRHPAQIRLATRVDDDGRLLSLEGEVLMDGGAYLTLSPVVLSRAVLHLTGPYRCEHVHIHGKVVATNTPPNGAFRGFGAPQALWAIERHMDRIARQLNLSPVEVRRINLLNDGDTTATGQTLRGTSGHAVLEKALAAAPPRGRPRRPLDARPRRRPGLARLRLHRQRRGAPQGQGGPSARRRPGAGVHRVHRHWSGHRHHLPADRR